MNKENPYRENALGKIAALEEINLELTEENRKLIKENRRFRNGRIKIMSLWLKKTLKVVAIVLGIWSYLVIGVGTGFYEMSRCKYVGDPAVVFSGMLWPVALPMIWTVDIMEEWFGYPDPAEEIKAEK